MTHEIYSHRNLAADRNARDRARYLRVSRLAFRKHFDRQRDFYLFIYLSPSRRIAQYSGFNILMCLEHYTRATRDRPSDFFMPICLHHFARLELSNAI